MKKTLSFKLFELPYYYSLLIILTAAFAFISLLTVQYISEDEYKNQLESYAQSYIRYNEISPEIVKNKIAEETARMNWSVLLKFENKIYTQAKSLNNDQITNWKKYQDVHERFNNLLTNVVSSQNKDLKVNLDNKIEKFYKFVEKNDWRRLTRISERLKLHSQIITTQSLDKLKQEIERVKLVTEKSLLSNYEKSAILARIARMTEVEIFEKLLKSQKDLLIVGGVYNSLFTKWYQEVGEVFSVKRNQFTNNDFYLTAFSVMSLFFLINGFAYFLSRQKRSYKEQDQIEQKFEKVIESIIFRNKELNLDDFSESFKNTVARFKEHLFRRMNFGTVAEEGIPFPSILVDQNLKVCWMNKLAQSKLGINFNLTENNHLSWDQLKELTSFHDFDPVSDGIKFSNGGIFDTNIKLADGSFDRAEFFVSPVNIEEEKYVFLSFQLQSYYQEVLENNKSSILTPLEETFNYLSSEEFEKVDIEKKKVFFDTTETKKIYPYIEKFVNRYIEAITSLKEALKIACEDNNNKDEELHALINSKETNIKVMVAQTENFKALKKNIANLDANIAKNFHNISEFQSTLSEHIGSIEGQQSLINNLKVDLSKVKTNIGSFKSLLHNKDSLTDSLRGQKIEIKHMTSRMANVNENTELSNKLEQLVKNLESMDQFYRDLDVYLGKLEYYFTEIGEKEELMGYDLDHFTKKVEREFFLIDQMESNFESILDNFATNLESQFSVLRNNKVLSQKFQESASDNFANSSEMS